MIGAAIGGMHTSFTLGTGLAVAALAVALLAGCALSEAIRKDVWRTTGRSTLAWTVAFSAMSAWGLTIMWRLPLSENLLGPHDQGMYAAVAGALTQEGTVLVKPAAWEHVAPGDRQWFAPLFLAEAQRRETRSVKFRGESGAFFFSDAALAGPVRPRFPIGFSVYLAGLRTLGGDALMLRANLLATSAGALLLGWFAFRWLGLVAGAAAAALWLAHPLTHWSATRLYAEPLLLLSWLVALIALSGKGWRMTRGWIAGLILGMGPLIKIDAMATIAAALILTGAVLFFAKARNVRRQAAGLGAGLLLGGAAASAALASTSATYYRETLRALYESSAVAPAALAGMLGALFLWRFLRKPGMAESGVQGQSSELLFEARTWIPIGLAVACAYFWWIRSGPDAPEMVYLGSRNREIASLREETFLRLAWYWTTPGLLVALTGALLLWRKTMSIGEWLFLLTGWVVLLYLAYDIRCLPAQPYAMRRFLAFGLPLLTVGTATWTTLPLRHFRTAGSLVPALLTCWLLVAKPAADPNPEFSGMRELLAEIAATLPENALVIVPHAWKFSSLVAPLRHLHGVDGLLVEFDRENQAWSEAIERLLEARGDSSFFTLSPSPRASFFTHFEQNEPPVVIEKRFRGQRMEPHRPDGTPMRESIWRVHRLSLSPMTRTSDPKPAQIPREEQTQR